MLLDEAPTRLRMPRGPLCWLGALAMLLMACGSDATEEQPDAGAMPDAAEPTVDLSEALFQPDHVLEVSIVLDDADWAILRNQPDAIGTPKITCGSQPTDRAYDYFPGNITVDGVTISNVGVRKKGGFGSITSDRPGLKVKANEYIPGQRISGLKRLTLNNNHQDPTRISQCLGYDLFRAAGLPAPRCSFAHVTVNGEDLGIYSNVESIKKDFLRRHFADETGRLYESGGDFEEGNTDGFQPKVNKSNPDCSDLDPVVTAMQAPDAEFPAALGAVVDMDAFMTHWAMEVITDHWDGYANNRNNFFFYHDPTSDQLHFIPWGIDALFTGRSRTTRPSSVFACGSLAWRLYDVAETRTLYLEKLRDLLDSVWSEAALLDEISRMQTLIEPIEDPTGSGSLAAQIDRTRAFVSSRKATLLAELDAGTPVWPYAANESCRPKIGSLTATFDTTWDTLDDYAAGSGTMDGTVGGVSVTSSVLSAGSGPSEDARPRLRLSAQLADGTIAFVIVTVNDPADFVPGTLPIDVGTVAAFMTFYDPVTDTATGGGLMLGGNLTLSSAGTGVDAPITGSITGDVVEL